MASLALPHKKFTRDEVNRMLETDIFAGQRFELIDGELIDKMGQSPRHAWTIHRLMVLLADAFGIERVLVQMPIEAGPGDNEWNQPEPDIALLAAEDRSDLRHPDGHELTLAVEVADTTILHDANRKRDLYATAGVPEYWVLDIDARRLLVFRKLEGELYTESLTLSETDTAPHINRPVAELLS